MRMDFGLVGLAGCFADWILTRPWGRILLSFLPIFFAATTVGLVVAGSWISRDTLVDRYLKLADAEVSAWEESWAPTPDAEGRIEVVEPAADEAPKPIPASAEMLYRRVQQLHQNDARSVFFVALCYIQRGASQQGLAMLNRIAPPDRVGYPQAHAYLTEQLLIRPIAVNDIQLARHHAQAALRSDRLSPQLLAMISDFFYKLGERDTALRVMQRAAKADPKFNLLLAQQTIGGSNKIVPEEALAKAKKHFEDKLAENPQDIPARLMLADTFRLNSDFESAERIILEGLKANDSPLLKSALSEVYRQAFVKTAKFTGDSWTGDIELLEKALHLDPNNGNVFAEIAKLARIGGKAPNEKLMAQLRANLAEGRATSVTHMWIAEHYLVTNQFEKAVPHLEQAVKRDPTAAACWNNLAYCLADLDESRLEEALKAVEQAIALAPMESDFHDTRGTILMKMKRFGDAIAAFERAIEVVAKVPATTQSRIGYHERLAKAYTAVGDQPMADTHQELATKLTQSIAKPAEDKKPEEPPM